MIGELSIQHPVWIHVDPVVNWATLYVRVDRATLELSEILLTEDDPVEDVPIR